MRKIPQGRIPILLAIHTDTDHTHLHVIFNNVNRKNGRTFETNMNQGKVKERAWKKLIDLSDEVCKRHHLDVIEHPERTKGKSHWEWDMNRSRAIVDSQAEIHDRSGCESKRGLR